MLTDQIETGSFGSAMRVLAQPEQLRVVSWNIARGSRLNAIKEFLIAANADLILLQECDCNNRRTANCNVAKDLAQELRMHYAFGIEFQELGQGSRSSAAFHGQATLSRWPLAWPRILRFRSQSKFWRPRWWIPPLAAFQRRIGGRMVLVTSLAVGARSVVLYNVHLESRSGDDLRCAQLAELLHDTRQYDFEPQVLVAGDFNFDLTADPQNSVLQQAGFANPFGAVRLPMISEPSRHRHAIDWILVRADAKVSFPEIHKSVSGSDHYPLSLTLQLQ